MTITLFSEEWYHGIINQTLNGLSEKTTPDGYALAKSVLVAGCVIAQSIDQAMRCDTPAGGSGQNLADAVRELGGVVDRIADAIEAQKQS